MIETESNLHYFYDPLPLSTEEKTIVDGLITRKNKAALSFIETMRGRNVYIKRPDLSSIPDSLFTHIQISGGFYNPFRMAGESVYIQASNKLLLPSAENIVVSHEDIFCTQYIRDDLTIGISQKEYVPTGAYTKEQVEAKAVNTMKITQLTELPLGTLPKPYRPFLTPHLLYYFNLSNITDIKGIPLHGMVLAVPKPTARFDIALSDFINRNKNQLREDPLIFFIETVSRTNQAVFKIAQATRVLHDLYQTIHGQITLGNSGLISETPLSYDGNLVYIADWDTMKELSQREDKQQMERALESLKLFYSYKSVVDFLIELTDLKSVSYILPSTYIGGFNSILNGYCWSDLKSHFRVDIGTILDIFEQPLEMQCQAVAEIIDVVKNQR